MEKPFRLAVLGSGKGSNFTAILDAVRNGRLAAEVALVVADRADAGILETARAAGLETFVIEEPQYRTRLSPEVEEQLVAALRARGVELVVLAGFLRVVKNPLLTAFPERIVNIHPSLLPAFPGLEAWKQALDAGVSVTGCTVHLVDAGIDTGRVLAQAEVPVHADDSAESLHARIQRAEHALYPRVLAEWIAEIRGRAP